jgi:CubicO group peptidase (beta-lactamase class C family)
MKYHLFALLALFLFQSCSEVAPIDPANDAIKEVETNLTTQVYIKGDATWSIEERMEHYGVPGVSIAVIHNGEIAWAKAYGIMDKESKFPVTKETLFQAASISKPVTAYGALTLVEQGKVDLNEDINTYLESWKLPKNEFTEAKTVTLKNLLNHSAGVTVHGFLGYSPGLPVPSLVEVLNGTLPANSGAIFVDKTPEESYRYSGGGYNIIQQMMIDVEAKTFPEIMKELVLQPLGMDHSTYDQPLEGDDLKMAPTGYLPDGSMTKGKRHTYPEMAPAGLWTTAEDLAQFAIAIQEGLKGDSEKGLSQNMTATMLTPFVEDFTGLGIFLKESKGDIYFEHGGWNEGFSSQLVAHKDKGYGVVVMTNSNHPDFISELIRSVALTYEWDNYFSVYEELEVAQSVFSTIGGRYIANGNEVVEILELDGELLVKKAPWEDPMDLIKVSDTTFVTRENSSLIQFIPSSETESMDLVIREDGRRAIRSTYTKMGADEKVPMELLMEGDFDAAMEAMLALKKEDPNNPLVSEGNLNSLGYELLSMSKTKLAQDIFKVNTMLYPTSSNVYDSYAEASMILGENDLAIENYEKAFSLDPKNINAKNMIEELQNK